MSKIFFSYIEPKNFSGQTAATKLIIDRMTERGYDCRSIKMYPLERSGKFILISLFRLIFKQLTMLPVIFQLLLTRRPILHLTLGQSTMSFLRVAVWLFPVMLIKPGLKLATSLNGSSFMRWNKKSFRTRFFLLFLKRSGVVTVLGEKQKSQLLTFGIRTKQIAIVPNTCELTPVSSDFIIKKHSEEEVNILHLSLLIESKGFPEYLEAVEKIAEKKREGRINAVLCGPVSFTSYCTRFKTAPEKETWIETKIDRINRLNGRQLKVEWIRGARGEAKEKLFRDAHIFVLPTTFPVEAQPLVLLEALSAGCAVISSNVGEIESVLNPDNAVLVEDTSAERIEKEIELLVKDPKKRIKLALNGLRSVNGPLSLRQYGETWESIFKNLK